MPNLSFTGHLAGVVCGHLQLYGLLDFIMIKDRETFREMEQWRLLKWMSAHPGFIPTPATDSSLERRDLSPLYHAVCRCVLAGLRFASFYMQVLVFGRDEQNENIQRGLMRSSVDDDDWNGLPSTEQNEQELV